MSEAHNLPTLRESLEQHGLMANKAFGQHFLLDLNITRKIVRLAQSSHPETSFEGNVVIEVGPGPGGLTRAVLETNALRLLAIEKDSRFLVLLNDLKDVYGERFEAIEGDALKVNETTLLADRNLPSRAHIVSNLPYNVGTPLLIKWLTSPWQPASMTLMFQLEVARRVVATTGSDDYGRLSVIAQCLCDCQLLMDLPARAFTPPPKVDSAVVKLVPKAARPGDALIKNLEKITAAAFGQRRKMLRSSLKSLGGEALLEKAGITPTERAEQVSPFDFHMLAVIYTAASGYFVGMTANERIGVAGLFPVWDRAFAARDGQTMQRIYEAVGSTAAESSVKSMLEDPGKYGF